MEYIVRISGMVLIVAFMVGCLHYIFTHMKRKTEFDYHIEKAKDKKGNLGVAIAYLTKFFLGLSYVSLCVLLIEFFENQVAFVIMFVSFILYIILAYFDSKY